MVGVWIAKSQYKCFLRHSFRISIFFSWKSNSEYEYLFSCANMTLLMDGDNINSTKPKIGLNVQNCIPIWVWWQLYYTIELVRIYWIYIALCSTGCSEAEVLFLDSLKWHKNEIYITKRGCFIITTVHHFIL